jgi:tetratricopeptide (TPR) repeat protein
MSLRHGGFGLCPKIFAYLKKGSPHMNLTKALLKQLDAPNLTPEDRAVARCHIAAEYIYAGQYEAAGEVLGDLWLGIGQCPILDNLTTPTRAEVLLQCGVLTGWLGSTRQIANAQERAKDLITEAHHIFHSLNQQVKVSEAQYEVGMCYWRTGSYDEARVVLQEALKPLGEKDSELKAKILIRRTLVEVWLRKYQEAWEMLKEAESAFESSNDALKGRWHGQMGLVLRGLAIAERRMDYFDRAIIEYTAAIYHYEQAGHERYCGTNLNNLAFLQYKLGRYQEAHEHLDRARGIFASFADRGNIAQVDETRARVLLAEKRYIEAASIISSVVYTLEKGGELALLSDALRIQGTIQAKLEDHEHSLLTFHRAINLAENAGALTSAGLAAVSLIEEYGANRLSEYQLYQTYRRADKLLATTQDIEDITRLRACAHIVMKKLLGRSLDDKDFYLPDVIQAYEARFVEQALEKENGSVTRAARRLGLSHQRFIYILGAKHRELLKKRTPATKHRRSIIRKERS